MNGTWGTRRLVALGLLTGAFLGGPPSVAGADEPLAMTHGMALDSVAAVVASDLLDGATLPKGAPVLVSEATPGDTLGLLTRRMVSLFRTRGHEVRLLPANSKTARIGAAVARPESAAVTMGDSTAVPMGGPAVAPAPASAGSHAVRLELQVDGSSVSYVRRIGGFPFGTKAYERLSAMRASATILESESGTVLWTRTSTRRSTDVVPKSQVRFASSGSGALNPALPPGGGSRWLEPLIVVGVVAGLVVLFYSNRN